jgi:hypothetical protein
MSNSRDKLDRADKSDRVESKERLEKPDKPERSDKADKPDRSEKPDRSDRSDKPDRSEEVEKIMKKQKQSDDLFLTTLPKPPTPSMCLVSETDVKEMNDCLSLHPKLSDVFKSHDDLIHALKVISSIKPNEKFSTSSGIYIQSEIQRPVSWRDVAAQYLQPLWLIRMKNGDDRISNLKAIKSIFVGALLVVEESLQERETIIKPHDPISRIDIVKKQKNEQLINRMAESITKAINSMENLKQTYNGDAHACARIDMMTETIRDRLALIKTSLDFLK